MFSVNADRQIIKSFPSVPCIKKYTMNKNTKLFGVTDDNTRAKLRERKIEIEIDRERERETYSDKERSFEFVSYFSVIDIQY
jgi:hypothetical protein